MHFLILSHALHKTTQNELYSYAPYVREMNLWLKYVDTVTVVAPVTKEALTAIDLSYKHNNLNLKRIPRLNFTNVSHGFKSVFKLPYILIVLFKACLQADHIHLRCPGNIGLLGCLVQVFFPNKIKTAKYAGNWDPKASQPLSYRIQKRILSNTFWTKNMTVLVYGAWKNQTKNIQSFFTATFKDSEKENVPERNYKNTLHFIFVGSLVKGKRPLLAIQILEALYKQHYNVTLNLYGDGVLSTGLKRYVTKHNLEHIITFHGNQKKEVIESAIKSSHFSILPSQSEGWPKAIAEAMFFGCIPIVTKISCVPYMLDYGNRGILIEPDVNLAVSEIKTVLKNESHLKQMSNSALKWSQTFTLDAFETEISKLLKSS